MSRRGTIAAVLGLYASIGLATFGHAAAYNDKWYAEHCMTRQARMNSGPSCVTLPWAAGVSSGLFWPLYWSWEAFS